MPTSTQQLNNELEQGNWLNNLDTSHLKVIKRNGSSTSFDATKINQALTKAFLAVEGNLSGSQSLPEITNGLTKQIVDKLLHNSHSNGVYHIEAIQDSVELILMRNEYHKVARAYVLYREQRNAERKAAEEPVQPELNITHPDGSQTKFDEKSFASLIKESCTNIEFVSPEEILKEATKNLYDGISLDELDQAPILAARTLIESEPNYSYVCARLLLNRLRREALSFISNKVETANISQMEQRYQSYFPQFIQRGIELEMIAPELGQFDLAKISAAIKPERDLKFQYLGLQTLYDRYFLHNNGNRYELPQAFFMRVAMGLSVKEDNKEDRAIEFYNLLSSFDFMSSTPTLFNSGTLRPQLSSCFLTTIGDDLDNIFKSIKDNALLSKYAGGIGNDWTAVRGLGAHIKGTNGKSQGVVPFLKVANDTAVAVNQGGKRKGAVCAYLETWHIDIESFLDLRKNTGDDRRRTHDMNTANWIPDLFMERVIADAEWTLFSPDEVPDLHDLYGAEFKTAYINYEEKAKNGGIKHYKTIRAIDLWRHMLTMLFETGHPWITFKDPCNLRSPQRHVGVVHSSNLCTEITLNSARDEVAVCNLGSVNLVNHITADGIDYDHLQKTVTTAMRMLDNVIDINYYTIPETRKANQAHRPVGLGLMGFQDALHMLRIPYASQQAVEFADISMEAISYYAIDASCNLAAERGAYNSFEGSLWSQGILPIDSIKFVEEVRDNLDMNKDMRLDWASLREKVKKGMRNSNSLAIAPTATISNICGVSQSIEPAYQNLFVKSNMSGDFTVVNANLVRDLKQRNLWDPVMVSDLKYYDGSVGQINKIPDDLKELYATAFEIDYSWLIEAASRRQKWLDQAQSLNLYIRQPSGRVLDQLYKLAWTKGLKTTYYLRSTSATHVEKSTLKGTDGKLNAVNPAIVTMVGASCNIDDPDCEACQ